MTWTKLRCVRASDISVTMGSTQHEVLATRRPCATRQKRPRNSTRVKATERQVLAIETLVGHLRLGFVDVYVGRPYDHEFRVVELAGQ